MRYLLILFVAGYLIWKLVQMISRGFGSNDRIRNVGDEPKKNPIQPYLDIKDAKFEDIKPEEESGNEKPEKNK